MKTYRYKLQPYAGMATRYTCPHCGGKHKFSRYIDTLTGQFVNEDVGRCERIETCGYHYKPYQYFRDLKRQGIIEVDRFTGKRLVSLARDQTEPVYTIPTELIQNLFPGNSPGDSHLLTFIATKFKLNQSQVAYIIDSYKLQAATFNRVLFPQIDVNQNYRTAKIMAYNPATGKRVRNSPGAFNWAHRLLIKQRKLPSDFLLTQCLFGEHLLSAFPGKPVGLVESEKTALICSLIYPKLLWMATGGKYNLTVERLQPISERIVNIIPDAGIYRFWLDKSLTIKRKLKCQIYVSDCIEKIASFEETQEGIDLADLILNGRAPQFF